MVSTSRTPGHTKHFQTLFLTPALESIDIDDPEDWEIAAALADRSEGGPA